MAIPQFHAEGTDQNGTGSATISFSGFTWSANDILEIVIATDGYVPTLSTANGFVLAQDPQGNTASATTNGGTAGTAECGIFVFWKRAVGSTTATDPEPVLAAPTNSGTCWCVQPNSFSGARTTGTPYTVITSGIVSTATTAVTSQAATWSLANCLLMPRVASSTDDQAFNSWTMSGSSGPSGTGAPNTGWHNGNGNQCAFTGDEGGYATAQTGQTATTTFANSTKQAMVTLVMASLSEPFGGDDQGSQPTRPLLVAPVIGSRQSSEDELSSPVGDGDAGLPAAMPLVVLPVRYAAASDDEFSGAAGGVVGDDDGTLAVPVMAAGRPPVLTLPSDDEVPATSGVAVVDEGNGPILGVPAVAPSAQLLSIPSSSDEAPSASTGAAVDEDNALIVAVPPNALPLPVTVSDDEQSPLAFTIEDDAPAVVPALVASVAPLVRAVDDEFPGGSLPAGIDEDPAAWPVLAPQRPALTRIPIPVDEIVTAPALSLGAAAHFEKANTTTPNTGTITTRAVYPAWTPSTTYQIINDTRVANAGNTYEVTVTSGTSASSGGPTGTPTPVTNGAITDGSAKWNFLAAGNGAVDTQPSGSLFLVTASQGNDATSSATPTDNKGNTYSLVGTKLFYAGFPQSSAAAYVAALPSTGGTGHTFSGAYGAGLDGGGDERTIAAVEIIGGTKIQDHSQGEFSPNGSNVVTSASVTTTQAAVLVCFCWLNGTVQPDGFLHTAIPGSGFSTLWLATGLLEIANGAGQVQMTTIAKTVSSAGTYTASITTANGEGAIMYLIAVQGADLPAALGADDDQSTARPRAVLQAVPRAVAAPDDELSPAADAGADDDVPRMGLVTVNATVIGAAMADDEVAGQAVVEDEVVVVQGVPGVAVRVTGGAADAEELPAIALEEWGQVMAVPVVLAVIAVPVASDDETTAAATTIEDDAVVSTVPAAVVPPLQIELSDDEVPSAGGASMIEEDALVSTVPVVVRPQLVTPPSVDEVASASGAAAVDEDQQLGSAVRVVAPVTSRVTPDDEVASGGTAVDEDNGGAGLVAAVPPVLRVVSDDDALIAPVLDDDASAGYALPVAVAVVLWVATDDDLPLAVLLDDAGQLVALSWSGAVLGQVVADDEVVTGVAPASIIDDDQLLTPLVWQVPAVWPGLVVPDELPRPKKAKPAGATGTSLLDGPIAKQVASALISAKLVKPATLIKVTPGVRTPGAVSAGVNSTRIGYACKGIEQNLLALQLAGTLIAGVDAAIRIFGATIAGGQVPVAGDEIQIAGRTYTIVEKGVSRDPAGASYLAQCRL